MKNRIGGLSVWRVVMGLCLLLAVGDAMAEVNPSRISLYGRNYAGRVLNANAARQTNWYMSYDVAVGFSTRSDSSVYAYKYGYPTWGVVIKANKLVAEFFEFSFGKTF